MSALAPRPDDCSSCLYFFIVRQYKSFVHRQKTCATSLQVCASIVNSLLTSIVDLKRSESRYVLIPSECISETAFIPVIFFCSYSSFLNLQLGVITFIYLKIVL